MTNHRNAGHKWPKVDAEIDLSREAIIQRNVQFLVDHLWRQFVQRQAVKRGIGARPWVHV